MSHKRILLIVIPVFVLSFAAGCVKSSSHRARYGHDRNYVIYPFHASHSTTVYMQSRQGQRQRHRAQPRRLQAHPVPQHGGHGRSAVTPSHSRHTKATAVHPRRLTDRGNHRMERSVQRGHNRMERSVRPEGHNKEKQTRRIHKRRIQKD